MNIAICDDNNTAIEYLSSICKEIPFISSIIPYSSPETLLSDIHSGRNFAALLMDIDFESEKNGIDYVEEIYRANPTIRTIYVTGYTERYVQHIFLKKSSLVGFVSKPAQKDILKELLSKAKRELDDDKSFLIFATGKGVVHNIACHSILYLESNAHKVLIHTETDNAVYTVYDRLTSFLDKLPSNFIQCHKSYLINMDKIKKIDKKTVFLLDGSGIQISKAYAATLKKDYFNYMQNSL